MAVNEPTIPALDVSRVYPRTETLGDVRVELRRMAAGDKEAMLTFARALSQEDLLFLPMDITRSAVVDDWIDAIGRGLRFTVLAESDGELAGYGSLHRQDAEWTRHMAEIRLIVSSKFRGCGLGAVLVTEILEVAREAGLRKVVAQMPRDQGGARGVFKKLGFDLESMLADWVIDRENNTHDLVIMAHHIS